MDLLLTGATGYIGSTVAARLVEAGHRVTALVRPGSDSAALPAGTTTVPGDVADADSLRRAADGLDGVVHLAPSAGAVVDLAAVRVLADAVRERSGLLLWTTGVWVLGPTGAEPATEASPTLPIAIVRDRAQVERAVLATGHDGVRAVVLRPGVVHGHGRGIPATLVDLARDAGTGRVVGDGAARWPMVHVDDLADLYLAAVERAAGGTVLHGVAEEGVVVRDLAAAAAHAADLPATSTPWQTDEAAEVLGAPFAEALALHQVVSAARTRFALGWHPTRPGAVADVAGPAYRAAAAA